MESIFATLNIGKTFETPVQNLDALQHITHIYMASNRLRLIEGVWARRVSVGKVTLGEVIVQCVRMWWHISFVFVARAYLVVKTQQAVRSTMTVLILDERVHKVHSCCSVLNNNMIGAVTGLECCPRLKVTCEH